MKHFDHECLWNGPVWPFATTQTLDAVIAYLQGGGTAITPDDFTRMLLTYAYSQRDEDGTPYVDENMHPDTGVWAREKHSPRVGKEGYGTRAALQPFGVHRSRPPRDCRNRPVFRRYAENSSAQKEP